MDDKAYVRPGTSEGYEKTRRVKILNLANEGAKQLPKYDWPEAMVYQTPSVHRIMTKKVMEIGSEMTTLVDNDCHFVVVRPKAFVDSSGTTWPSEIVRLRTLHPEVLKSLQLLITLRLVLHKETFFAKLNTPPSNT